MPSSWLLKVLFWLVRSPNFQKATMKSQFGSYILLSVHSYLVRTYSFLASQGIKTLHCTKNEIFHQKILHYTKMKFSIKNFFSKFYQIRRFLRIYSHLLKQSLLKNFIFCAALTKQKSGTSPVCNPEIFV